MNGSRRRTWGIDIPGSPRRTRGIDIPRSPSRWKKNSQHFREELSDVFVLLGEAITMTRNQRRELIANFPRRSFSGTSHRPPTRSLGAHHENERLQSRLENQFGRWSGFGAGNELCRRRPLRPRLLAPSPPTVASWVRAPLVQPAPTWWLPPPAATLPSALPTAATLRSSRRLRPISLVHLARHPLKNSWD